MAIRIDWTDAKHCTPAELQEIGEFVTNNWKQFKDGQIANYLGTDDSSLLQMLQTGSRFKDTGRLYKLYKDFKLVAISGCEYHEGDMSICIGGIRTLSSMERPARGIRMSDTLLKYQLDWAEVNGCGRFWLTLNDWNKRLYDMVASNRPGVLRGIFKDDPFWEGLVALPEPIVIRNVKQWVLERKL